MQPNTPKTQDSIPALQPCATTAQSDTAAKPTYGEILKSSVLIGGSSVVKIGISVVRTKAMAVFLGPAGVGLMGIYGSIIDFTRSIAEMGINSSGVRQIAEAVGSGEKERVARTVTVLRRVSIVLGVAGAAILVLSSKLVSKLTFGSDQYTVAVALLSLAVFFGLVSGGQSALIQGMRRIGDLAKMGILGALYGTVISVTLVYFLREKGIIPSLVAIAGMGILTSWWFSRKVQIQTPSMTMSQVRQEATALLKLGFAFMASGVLTMGAAYAVKIVITRKIDIEAAGLYQSAWALGGLYVGFILQAMGADFYPRLTAIAKNNAECNRLVNEQAEVSILLAGPGMVATMTFAPLVIALFYTSKFTGAVEPLRWICLGLMLRVVAWPMGYIVLAKGAQAIFFWTEVAATIIHVGLAWLAVGYYGLAGAGIAFFGLYVWHTILIYFIVRRLSGFRWSAENRRIGPLILALVGLVFCSFYLLPFWAATTVGTTVALLCGIYSLRTLQRLLPQGFLPRPIQRLLRWLRLAPSDTVV